MVERNSYKLKTVIIQSIAQSYMNNNYNIRE